MNGNLLLVQPILSLKQTTFVNNQSVNTVSEQRLCKQIACTANNYRL
jgi:hypothetical protein